jgi:two-component system, cell cycle response regulator DivK
VTTVAVVDDSADTRLLLRALLEGAFRVVEYGSGPDALAGFATDQPHLVILDITMPGMDGPEMLAALRANGVLHALPVIALTGHAAAGDRARYIAAGFDDYVTKPIIDESALTDAIARCLADRTA